MYMYETVVSSAELMSINAGLLNNGYDVIKYFCYSVGYH